MKRLLSRSIIVLSLLFLFLVGIYIGNKTSYSVTIGEEMKENSNTSDDGVLFLSSIELDKKEAKALDNVYVNIKSSGASLDGATINLVRSDGKYSINLNVKGIYEKPFVEIPKYVNTGDYVIKSVSLVGNNSDGSTFIKNYTENPKSSDDVLFNFNNKIKLVADPQNLDIDLIKSIKLNTNNFKPGSKVYLDIDYDKDIRVVRLNFTLDSYRMYSYINSIARNPYIIIPQSAKVGEYVLDEIYVETYNYGSVSYSTVKTADNKYLAYDSRYYVLSGEDNESETVYYDNANISGDIIAKISTSEKIKKIEIMSEDSPVISQDLFSSIKGGNKQLIIHYKDIKYIFVGNDIDKEKTFNATVDYKEIDSNSEFSKYVKDGLLLEFAANGDLPGKAKVVLEKSSLFNKVFKQDHVNVYYYNESNKEFELIKENLIIGQDEISFDIDHTSTYIMTNSKINNSIVYSSSEKNDDKNENKKEKVINKPNILLIIIIVLAIIIVILLIILITGKKSQVVNNNEEDEESSKIVEEDFDEEDLRENISKANEESFDDE